MYLHIIQSQIYQITPGGLAFVRLPVFIFIDNKSFQKKVFVFLTRVYFHVLFLYIMNTNLGPELVQYIEFFSNLVFCTTHEKYIEKIDKKAKLYPFLPKISLPWTRVDLILEN